MARMWGTSKRIVASLVRLGIDDAASPQLEKRMRLTNGLALIACVLMGLWLIGDIVAGAPDGLVVSLPGWLVTLVPLALARLRLYDLACYALILALNTMVGLGAFCFPAAAGGALTFIPLVGLPLTVFDLRRDRLALAGAVALPVVLFVLCEARAYLLPPFPTMAAPAWAYGANAAAALIGSFMVVLHFHLENRRSEALLTQSLEETRLNQTKLLQSSKMSALGQMAAAIAHEVKSPLVTICGSASILRKSYESGRADPTRNAELAARIEATGFRIGRIVSSLQTFARDGAQDPLGAVGVAKVLSETLELCRQRFTRSSVELHIADIPPPLEVWGRPVQLSQVLLNLLNNACDAVADLPESDRWVRIVARDEGGMVELSVTDGGAGIPLEIQPRIMEAFFTTKPHGLGTGLGLSPSRSLVEQHGGTLLLDTSAPNTRFVVRWPKPASATLNATAPRPSA